MVEIAKAVTRNVRVLLMDEPTDVLTGRETEVLFGLIRRLKTQGVAVIYISHKLGEISAIANRVSVLRNGELITTQPTAELTQDEMANLMVGRELSDMYPPKRKPGTEVVFTAKNISVPGSAKTSRLSSNAEKCWALPDSSGRGGRSCSRASWDCAQR